VPTPNRAICFFCPLLPPLATAARRAPRGAGAIKTSMWMPPRPRRAGGIPMRSHGKKAKGGGQRRRSCDGTLVKSARGARASFGSARRRASRSARQRGRHSTRPVASMSSKARGRSQARGSGEKADPFRIEMAGPHREVDPKIGGASGTGPVGRSRRRHRREGQAHVALERRANDGRLVG